MHRGGMRKHHGDSIRSLTNAAFTLPFVGKKFFHSIVLNSELPYIDAGNRSPETTWHILRKNSSAFFDAINLQCVGLSKNKLTAA